MICVSIFANDFDFCLDIVSSFDFVELRLDHGKINNTQLAQIISSGKKIISTCRSGFINDEERCKILLSAIWAGTTYIDIEHDFNHVYKNELIETTQKKGCKIIHSYHNFESTPDYPELMKISTDLDNQCDIVKIACKANSQDDVICLLDLYKEFPKGRLITIGMGEAGKITRIAGLYLGAPFTYSSLDEARETSAGQIDYETLKKLLNGLGYERG